MKPWLNFNTGGDIYLWTFDKATLCTWSFALGPGCFNVTNEFGSKNFLVNQLNLECLPPHEKHSVEQQDS